ncbi:MAG: hypothetical protein ACFFDH_13520 [Promethearchaeota archaeon]
MPQQNISFGIFCWVIKLIPIDSGMIPALDPAPGKNVGAASRINFQKQCISKPAAL